jgi:hypothetical protein
MTAMPRTSVTEVLSCFDDEFAVFASAFARGEYLLWLGSGISRDVVPGVPELLERMLEFLRSSIDTADSNCRFKAALEEVLDVGAVPAATRESIDLATEVSTWSTREDIIGRLGDRYADVLDVQVHGEAEDFLVWTVLDVPATYGDPSLEPDVEHLCVAILMLEGMVRSAPTTNWDGLVEAAMARLVEDADQYLSVIVEPADFTGPVRQAELVKFHGCARRAAANEVSYRGRLIARKSQISGWTTRPENQMMKNHLEHLFASRPALFVGLSAQDANIHTVLHEAIRNLARSWPTAPAAVVFAEQQLHHHHKLVMRVTYGDTYTANADAIGASALLGAFAKPTLVGLVLFTLADKLCTLIPYIPGLSLTESEVGLLCADIRHLRDSLGRSADMNSRSFMDGLVSGMALALTVFRTGRAPDPAHLVYQQLSVAPVAQAINNPDFPAAVLGRLAIVVALLYRGMLAGSWTIEPGSNSRPGDGVVRVTSHKSTSQVFAVRDARALSQLEVDGVVDPDDDRVLVIQVEGTRPATIRSPRPRFGRTGRSGARHVDVESICSSADSAAELFDIFSLVGAL